MESTSTIPVVDFSAILRSSDPGQWTAAVEELDRALSTIGFVYLKNHGVPTKNIERAFEVGRSFFELPADIKALYTKRFSKAKTEGPGNTGTEELCTADFNGFVPAGDEMLDASSTHEIREAFDVMGAGEGRIFPSDAHAPGLQSAVEALRADLIVLGHKVTQDLAVALLGPEHLNFFKDRLQSLVNPFVSGLNQLRLLWYPEIPVGATTGVSRCFEHTDYGMFTFLMQDGIGGLEVKDVQGNWVPAPPVEGTILVNTGDLLQFWSGGHYPATVHRVRMPESAISENVRAPRRQSIAFFVSPDDHVNVAPLQTKFSSGDGEKGLEAGVAVNALDYVMGKIKNEYGIGKDSD